MAEKRKHVVTKHDAHGYRHGLGPCCCAECAKLRDPRTGLIKVAISQAEQDHHADLRRRSYELAVARRHINRYPS